MISKKKVKEFAEKENSKKISEDAIKKLDEILEEKMRKILKKSSRSADFAGRTVIRKEDILEPED